MTTLTKKVTRPSKLPAPGNDASARLALELAMNIKSPAAIAAEYGLSTSELSRRLKSEPQLAGQVTEYRKVWNHPMNAAERVRIKTAVLVEDGLPDLWALFTNTENNPNMRLDVHKHLTKLADVEPKREADNDIGSRFNVTIVLPGAEPMEIHAATGAEPIEHAA